MNQNNEQQINAIRQSYDAVRQEIVLATNFMTFAAEPLPAGEFGPAVPTVLEAQQLLLGANLRANMLRESLNHFATVRNDNNKKFESLREHVNETVKAFGARRYRGTLNENAREFWGIFREFLERQAYGLEEVATYALPILKVLVEAPNASNWFSSTVDPLFDENNPVTMEKLEDIFIKGWLDTITLSMEETTLHIFAWGGKETGPTFVNRMNGIYKRNNIDTTLTRIQMPGACNFIMELYNRLPFSVRQSPYIQHKEPEGYATLHNLLNDVRRFPGIRNPLKSYQNSSNDKW